MRHLVRLGRDFVAFLASILGSWQAYVTGGIVSAATGIYEHWTSQSLSWHAYQWGVWSFLFVAIFVVWRKERVRAEAAEAKLAPKLEIAYDNENSLFTPEHETYRLRISNTGIEAVDDVELRIISAPSLKYLSGFLPMILREQHALTGQPFTLKGDTPRYFDFFEYSERLSAQVVNNGAQLVLFCHDVQRAHHASFAHAGENVVEVEVSGRNVPPCRKTFSVRSLLPNRRPDGASLEITEIAEVARRPDRGRLTRGST